VLGCREDLLASNTDQLQNQYRVGEQVFVEGTLTSDYLGNFGNTTRFGFLTWSALYSDIQNTNTLIANIDKVPATTTDDIAKIERIKGEAYFIRAYEYTQLLRGFGGVVLSDTPFQLGQDFLSINNRGNKRFYTSGY
jgi:hypothetical protein